MHVGIAIITVALTLLKMRNYFETLNLKINTFLKFDRTTFFTKIKTVTNNVKGIQLTAGHSDCTELSINRLTT